MLRYSARQESEWRRYACMPDIGIGLCPRPTLGGGRCRIAVDGQGLAMDGAGLRYTASRADWAGSVFRRGQAGPRY